MQYPEPITQYQTLNVIIPILSFLASTGGAGIVASMLFDKLRATFKPKEFPGIAPFLHAPRYARWVVMVLAMIIGVLASIPLAYLQSQDILLSVDAALAASLSAIVSQVKHSFRQSNKVKEEMDTDE